MEIEPPRRQGHEGNSLGWNLVSLASWRFDPLSSKHGFEEADLWDACLQCRFDGHGQGDGRGGAALAGAFHPDLDDVVVVDADDFDLAAVGAEAGPDLVVEDRLDLIEEVTLARHEPISVPVSSRR